MKKFSLGLLLGVILLGALPTLALAANATNWSGTQYVWGNPITNPDGSISAAMPNGWGSYGADPFDTWSGVYGAFDGALAGKTWYINNHWLDDWGGRKTAELLGLNVPIYNNPGTCPLKEIAAKTITNVICGSNSGRETPPGSWRYYSIDPLGNNSFVALEAYADYFLMGRDNVANYLFQNRYSRSLGCYSYFQPYLYGNETTFEQMKSNIENFNVSLCSSTYPYAPVPVGDGTSGGTSGTGTTGGTAGGTGTYTITEAETAATLASTKALVDSVRERYEKIAQDLGQYINSNFAGIQNITAGAGNVSLTPATTLPTTQQTGTTLTTLSQEQVAQVQNQILVLLLQVVELQAKLAGMQ
jgi:hypothetical protein